MIFRLRNMSLLVAIAVVATAIWAYTAYDSLMVRDRTTTDTTTAEVAQNQPMVDEIPDVEFVETHEEDNGLTPPATNVPEVPGPENRVPGTTLSDEILDELGLEERPETENVFYATATPNDAIYPQWYTTTINAPNAWDVTTGSNTTLVAVIDTGYALGHEDLASAWFINDGEQGTTASGDACWTGTPANKQTNGCDDDSNGYIDDWRGWDFSNNDNNPQAGDNSVSGATHGTKSAGLVGARGNNSVGVASVNWQTEILPLQALYDEGFGFTSDITAAVYYAVAMGADVINLSLGGPTPDASTRAAVQYAEQNNVIVVAASGNCGINQTDPECIGYPSPGGMGYPARYPETIAVGATTSSDSRASFSSFGDEVDIVAPGSGTIRTPTWSTSNGTSLYSTSSFGTSFSSPIVAGAIALLKGEYPELTRGEAIALMNNGSDKVAGMSGANWTQEYGFGRLNVLSLLDELNTYQQQLLKGSGRIELQNPSTKPLVSTNTGHTSATAIGNSTEVRTTCVTTPNTLCRLTLDRQGSSTQVIFDQLLTNSQGIAVFEWSKSDAASGTWDATVTANSQTSNSEELVIQ